MSLLLLDPIFWKIKIVNLTGLKILLCLERKLMLKNACNLRVYRILLFSFVIRVFDPLAFSYEIFIFISNKNRNENKCVAIVVGVVLFLILAGI
jgi:hypothetical protein